MRLILTRPLEDSQHLADKLLALGHQPTICPLLAIVPRQGVSIPASPYQAIIATSANGFCQPEILSQLHDTPVYTVGPQSLAAARAQGFHHVQAQGSTVTGLCEFLKATLSPANGALLYLTGAEISSDLKAIMEQADFTVDRLVLYDAVPLHPADLKLEMGQADGVLLYSPRTAKLWCDEVNRLEAQPMAAQLRYYCLSPAIANLLPESWRCKIATSPHQGAMLSLLDRRA